MTETDSKDVDLPRSARRVASALERAGHPATVVVLDDDVRTAIAAADALGVTERQILKSMVFRGVSGDRLVLVLLPGDRRVDTERLTAELGEPVRRAEPDWVREKTGFAIGGIPPIGHLGSATTVIDREALAEATLWAAAGTPDTVFETSGARLEELTDGLVADVGLDR